jgi:SAM-dependent methyltransferase
MPTAADPPAEPAPDPFVAWSEALRSWEIPSEIIDRATEPPWAMGDAIYVERARTAAAIGRGRDGEADPSRAAALEALAANPEGTGSVLDVGAGAGAAGLALAARCTRLTAVDRNERLLATLREEAAALDLPATTLAGRWPELARRVAVHDVAVCHHVLYDVPDLAPFLGALAEHARRRVVIEISARHPLAWVNPLWLRFHGIRRPERPSADDAVAAVHALGAVPSVRRWTRPTDAPSLEAAVTRARRNLCLPPEREPEVAAAIEDLRAAGRLTGGPASPERAVVTIWWDPPGGR